MSNTTEIMQKFQFAEAQWLDSVVRPMIPTLLVKLIDRNKHNVLGRLGHFLVDYFYIARVLGIKITRNQNTTLLGGRGFRQGVNHGYRVDRIRTTVLRRGKEIAQQSFALNIIIKQ